MSVCVCVCVCVSVRVCVCVCVHERVMIGAHTWGPAVLPNQNPSTRWVLVHQCARCMVFTLGETEQNHLFVPSEI